MQGMFAGLTIKFTMCYVLQLMSRIIIFFYFIVCILANFRFSQLLLPTTQHKITNLVCFIQFHIYCLLHFPTRSISTAATAVQSMLMGTLVVIAARHHCIIVSTQLHGGLIQFINVSAGKEKFLLLKMTEHCYRHPQTSSLLVCRWEIRRCFQTHFSFEDASKLKGIVCPKLKFHPWSTHHDVNGGSDDSF